MILCQEGYRSGTKITAALEAGILDGVIISPRYHTPQELPQTIAALRSQFPAAFLVVDPEFHVGIVTGDRVGKLAEYQHYHDDLDWSSFTASRISEYANEVLALQQDLPVTRILSPGIAVRTLRDWQGATALGLFDQTIRALGQPEARERLLLTLVVGDELLCNQSDVDQLLNVITILDCRGFYVSVDRQNPNDTLWCVTGQETAVGNLLYLVRTLALNGFEVVCGYTDFTGVLMLGAGAAGVASGWYKKQRLFDSGRFAPAPPGGRAPKDYYPSMPLLNWIPLSPDIDILERAGQLESLVSGTSYDSIILDPRRSERWNQEVSIHAFWSAMQQVDTALVGMNPDQRNLFVDERLATAASLWRTVRAATRGGPALSTVSTNIQAWIDAYRYYHERLGR